MTNAGHVKVYTGVGVSNHTAAMHSQLLLMGSELFLFVIVIKLVFIVHSLPFIYRGRFPPSRSLPCGIIFLI